MKRLKIKAKRLEAQIAITYKASEAESSCLWVEWKRHYWPADVVRPGLNLYGFDTSSRRLCVLLQITRAGSFEYRTRNQLASAIEAAAGFLPNQEDRYWSTAAISSQNNNKPCFGIAIQWKVLKRVNIPLDVRFPELGWLRLAPVPPPDLDPGESFSEGSPQLRSHMRIERNRTLRLRSKQYWRQQLGSIKCLVCGFDYAKHYGPLGADFIEMHHDRALSHRQLSRNTRIADLKPLCANCHRMAHRGAEVLTAQRLKALLKRRIV